MAAEPYIPTDRRPIASRERRVWVRAAAWLAHRGISPNVISITGMFAGIAAGAAFAATRDSQGLPARALWIAAAALVQLRLIANMLDGMVALESRTASPLGELYNEVPDRVSDTATLLGLGYAAASCPTLGWIAAVLAVFVAYVRAAAKTAGAPHDYCGPMAKPHRMFVVTLAALYAGLMPTAWQPRLGPHALGIPAAALLVIIVGCIATAWRRLARAARTLRKEAR